MPQPSPGCCCCMPLLHNHLCAAKGGCICTPLTPLNPPLGVCVCESVVYVCVWVGVGVVYVCVCACWRSLGARLTKRVLVCMSHISHIPTKHLLRLWDSCHCHVRKPRRAIPFCRSTILPFCHSAILPFCHSAVLPFCHSEVARDCTCASSVSGALAVS